MAGDASIGEKPSTNPITLSGLFTNIANALRAKKGTTTAIKAVDFPSSIQSLPVLDTSDATATAANILSGKTAYVKGAKVTGNIASQAAQTITPGTADKTIASGKYLSGTQTIKGDANLKSGNIKKGVSIFGVEGSYEGVAGLVPATVTIGTQQSISGISLFAGPPSGDSSVNVQCLYFDFDTHQFIEQLNYTDIARTPMQLKCALGSAFSVFDNNQNVQLVGCIEIPNVYYSSRRVYMVTSENAAVIYPDS